MKTDEDYIKDIAEIRSMMERSSKFLSLSGWAGIMAGIYALVGAYIAYAFFRFQPTEATNDMAEGVSDNILNIIYLGIAILVMSVGTAIFLSFKRATNRSERVWNATSRRMVTHMAMPLVAGGILILVFISMGLFGLLAPLTLLFYGLALYSAGNYTYKEIKYLGIIQTALGLISAFYIEYGLLFWAIGFGLMHIVYGIYIHVKHER